MSGPCPGCGAETARYSTWCSQACNARHRRAAKERDCIACGKRFYRRPGESRDPKYCSRDCRYRHKRENAVNYPKQGKRALHRIVAEQSLGRPLRRGEVVHHKDGNILNFRPDNLEVLQSHAEHMRRHAEDRAPDTEAARDRGRRSGQVRREKMLERSARIATLVEAGENDNERIAQAIGVSVHTVRRLRCLKPHCLDIEAQRALFFGAS